MCHSDHYSLVIDIKPELFKLNTNENRKQRALVTTNPKQVKQYKQEVYEQIQQEPFRSEVHRLLKKQHKIHGEDIHLINRIDSKFKQIRMQSENFLRKKLFNIIHHGQLQFILRIITINIGYLNIAP